MNTIVKCITSIILLPFTILWWILPLIISLTGRIIAAFAGIALMVVGAVMVCTVVLFPLGIPAFVLGVLLLARSIL